MFLKIFEKVLLAFWQTDVRKVEVLGLTLIHNAVINIKHSLFYEELLILRTLCY